MKKWSDCKKVRFASKEAAENHIKRMEIRNASNSRPAGTYFCSPCKSWHITSKRIRDDFSALTERIIELEAKCKQYELTIQQQKSQLIKFSSANRETRRELMREPEMDHLKKQIAAMTSRNKLLLQTNQELIIKLHKKENGKEK